MRDGTKTRKTIEQVALKLFVEQGITETTIKDIAREAGLTEGALYRHFPSKEELAWQLFYQNLLLFVQDLENLKQQNYNLKNQLKAMIQKAYNLYDKDPYLFRYLLLTEHSQTKKVTLDMPHTFNTLKDAISQGIKRNEIPKKDVVLATSMVLGVIRGVAVSKVRGRYRGRLSKSVDLVTAAAWRILKM